MIIEITHHEEIILNLLDDFTNIVEPYDIESLKDRVATLEEVYKEWSKAAETQKMNFIDWHCK